MTDGRVCCLLPSPLLFWRLLSFVLPHPVLSPAVVNYLLMSFTRLLLTLPWINTCSPTILSSFFNPGVSVPPHPWPLHGGATVCPSQSVPAAFPEVSPTVWSRLSESSLVRTNQTTAADKMSAWAKRERARQHCCCSQGQWSSACILFAQYFWYFWLWSYRTNNEIHERHLFNWRRLEKAFCFFSYLFIYSLLLFHLYIRAFSCEWSSNLRAH